MIHTAMQLKAKVRNLSGGDSIKAQTLLRNYFMERFLERIALSRYRDHFVLKGGMLVASMVGLETRATMDIDATVTALPLTKEDAVRMTEEIIAVELPDDVRFSVTQATDIMEEHDYPGIRLHLSSMLENLKQTIKVDISTGDVLTPKAVSYDYPLMFEDRSISLLSYNLETLLAEKLETIMARGTANTRLRDFYDVHVLSEQKTVQPDLLRSAFMATSRKRCSEGLIIRLPEILLEIENDDVMRRQWENYNNASFYVGDLSWQTVMADVKSLAETCGLTADHSRRSLDEIIADIENGKAKLEEHELIEV